MTFIQLIYIIFPKKVISRRQLYYEKQNFKIIIVKNLFKNNNWWFV